jgi:hypothetical protein
VCASTNSDFCASRANSGDLPFRAISRITLDEKSLEIAANCSDAGLIRSALSRTAKHLYIIDFTLFDGRWQRKSAASRSKMRLKTEDKHNTPTSWVSLAGTA